MEVPTAIQIHFVDIVEAEKHPVVVLSGSIIRFAEQSMDPEVRATVFSPRLMEAVIWFLARWSHTYLMPLEETNCLSNDYQQHQPMNSKKALLSFFGEHSQGQVVLDIIVRISVMTLMSYPGEKDLQGLTCHHLLHTLVRRKTICYQLVSLESWRTLANAFTNEKSLFLLSSANQRSLAQTLVLSASGLRNSEAANQYVKGLTVHMTTYLVELSSRSDLKSVAHQPDIIMSVSCLLERLRGAASAAGPRRQRAMYEIGISVMNPVLHLLEVYKDEVRVQHGAELKAIRAGLLFFLSSEWGSKGRLILESDCRNALEWIKNPASCPTCFESIVREIVSFVMSQEVILRLIQRSANWEVDELAKKVVYLLLKFIVDWVDGQISYLESRETAAVIDFCMRLLQLYSSHNIGKGGTIPVKQHNYNQNHPIPSLASLSASQFAALEISISLSSTLLSEAKTEKYKDLRALLQLLSSLCSKDLVDFSSDSVEAAGINISQVVFFGLHIVTPLISLELLKYPKLCHDYFSLLSHILEVYPETLPQLNSEAFAHIIGTLDFGLHHQDLEVVNMCLGALKTLAAYNYQEICAGKPGLVSAGQGNLPEGIFSRPDLVSAAADALLPLILCEQGLYQKLGNEVIERQTNPALKSRLANACIRSQVQTIFLQD
ncbi:RNA-binding protein 42-like [Hibiscus syriacus]|uniref:Exportin-4 n=1 Tax=Hibiscus syriacus TaxID=106335 RepID=A0A6A3B9Q1_HIBSY|nr:RNA-binding protein 42-like [Hibiscus syriacus]